MSGPKFEIGKELALPDGKIRVVGHERGNPRSIMPQLQYDGWVYVVVPVADAAVVGRLPVPTPTYTLKEEVLQNLQA
jgi:hypothetical protein